MPDLRPLAELVRMDRQVRRAPHSPHCIEHVIQTPAASNVTRRRAEAVSHGRRKDADARSFLRLLRLCSERRKHEAQNENDRETDQPNGHLGGGRLPRSLAERRDAHQHCAARTHHPGAVTVDTAGRRSFCWPQKPQKEWFPREDPPAGSSTPALRMWPAAATISDAILRAEKKGSR
jgi:hypothetical protein